MPRLIKIFSGAREANNPASRPSLILPAPRGRSAQPSLRIPAIVNARSRQNRSRWAGIGVKDGFRLHSSQVRAIPKIQGGEPDSHPYWTSGVRQDVPRIERRQVYIFDDPAKPGQVFSPDHPLAEEAKRILIVVGCDSTSQWQITEAPRDWPLTILRRH